MTNPPRSDHPAEDVADQRTDYVPLRLGGRKPHPHWGIALASPRGRPVCMWLWRKLPHPDTLVPGGPEIDFGIQSSNVLVLGEAKWRSPVGAIQGAPKDKDQILLRREFIANCGERLYPSCRHFVVPGVSISGGPSPPDHDPPAAVHQDLFPVSKGLRRSRCGHHRRDPVLPGDDRRVGRGPAGFRHHARRRKQRSPGRVGVQANENFAGQRGGVGNVGQVDPAPKHSGWPEGRVRAPTVSSPEKTPRSPATRRYPGSSRR